MKGLSICRGSWMWVGAVAIACSSSAVIGKTGPGDGGSSGPDAADFCRRYVEAFAAYLETCGCGAEAVEPFRAQVPTLCEPTRPFGNLSNAVATGDLIYDEQAAAALFKRLEEPAPSCVEEPYRALKLDSKELYSFAGVFTGTHALGSPCTLPVSYKGGISDCRDGVCASDAAGGGMCIALVGEGEPCDASGDENLMGTTGRLCFDGRPPDSDGEYESAFDSLACVPTAPGAATRVCVRDLADGEPCSSRDACRSGLCASTGAPGEGICTAKRQDGEVCTSHGNCRSGACQNREPRTCGALLADGEPCEYSDAACASGSCNDPEGNGGLCGPPPTRKVGETCSSSFDCISAGHGGTRDGVCHAGRCVADVCVAYLP